MQKCVAGKLGQKVALNLLAAFALLFGFFMTKFQFENAQSEREETHNERNKQYNEAHLVASLKQLQIEEDIPMYTKRITRRKTKAVAGTAGALWHEQQTLITRYICNFISEAKPECAESSRLQIMPKVIQMSYS